MIDGMRCTATSLNNTQQMKITEIWFEGDHICGKDGQGNTYRQSLLWYPALMSATDEQRNAYSFGMDGIHWRNLDEDVSFESFLNEEAEPSGLQRFFITNKEINVAEFARSIGMNASLLRNYINGFKKPSKEREMQILDQIHALGNRLAAVDF